jgi:hypothetical protein
MHVSHAYFLSLTRTIVRGDIGGRAGREYESFVRHAGRDGGRTPPATSSTSYEIQDIETVTRGYLNTMQS